jgi:hypothetical protein
VGAWTSDVVDAYHNPRYIRVKEEQKAMIREDHFKKAGYTWGPGSACTQNLNVLLDVYDVLTREGFELIRPGQYSKAGDVWVDAEGTIHNYRNLEVMVPAYYPAFRAPPPKESPMPEPTPVKRRRPRGAKAHSKALGKELATSFGEGFIGGGSNEAVRFLIAGLRRAGAWHPVFDTPVLAPVMEALIPAMFGMGLSYVDSDNPLVESASKMLMTAAKEPARQLGANLAHSAGDLARAVFLKDESALDKALKGMLPTPTATVSIDDIVGEVREKEPVCAESSSPSPSPSLAAPETGI